MNKIFDIAPEILIGIYVDLVVHRFHRNSKNTRVGIDRQWRASRRVVGGHSDGRHYYPIVPKGRLIRCPRIMKKR